MESLRLQVLCIEMLCPDPLQQLDEQADEQEDWQANEQEGYLEDGQQEDNSILSIPNARLPLKPSISRILQKYQQPLNHGSLDYWMGNEGGRPNLGNGNIRSEMKVKRRWSDMLKTCVSRMCGSTSGVAKIECSVKHCHYSM